MSPKDAGFLAEWKNALATGWSMEDFAKNRGQTLRSLYRLRNRWEKRNQPTKLPSLNSSRAGAPSVDPTTKEEELAREVTRLQIENSDLKRQVASSSTLRAIIHGAVGQKVVPPRWIENARLARSMKHGTPVLFLSDLHWGEEVSPEQVGGVNSYSMEIARERLRHVIETAISLQTEVMSRSSFPGIVVPLGGDMVSGIIHDELRETNSATLLKTVLDLLEHLISAITRLHDVFGRVAVFGVVGNHGRLDRKPRMKNAVYDNVDWLLYELLARHFNHSDESVKVTPSESFHQLFRVHSTRFLMNHGDNMRGGSGITGPLLPWALGDARARKRQAAIRQPYDVQIIGHWHTLHWLPQMIVNGSLKGYDEYAYKAMFGYERPKQALWNVHPEHGITTRWEVYADEQGSDDEAAGWVDVMK